MPNALDKSIILLPNDEDNTLGFAGVGFPTSDESLSRALPEGDASLHFSRGQIIFSSVPNMPVGSVVFVSHPPHIRKPDATDAATSEHPELAEALMDLYSLKSIAEEECDVAPDDETIDKADTLLRKLFRVSPRPYYVYTMPDGDIAIDADSPQDTKLVLVCSADGSARGLFYLDDKMTREKYEDLSEIPNRFILDALQKTQN